MDPAILAAAHPHIQEEVEKKDELIGTLEMALALASAAYVGQLARKKLPGTPPPHDAPAVEWVDYFVREGRFTLVTA